MAKRDELLTALRAVLGKRPGLAVIHSSLAALAPAGGLDRWDALYAIGALAREGWTLAFPAFTFSFCREGRYDPDNSASETGVLADWVQGGLQAARRTRHPIYSFVVVGPDGNDFDAYPSETTFGDTSPFALFEENDAHIVMLGTDWSFATPFHRYEEKAQVPYRSFKRFEGHLIERGDQRPISALMYVRDLEIAAENDFGPLVERLRADAAIVTLPLWRGKVEATRMQRIRRAAEALLSDDPLAFVGNDADVRHRLDMRNEANRLAPFRVALLGASNLDIASAQFQESIASLMPDRRVALHVPPFGRAAQEIMTPGSELAQFDPEMTVFPDRLEDLLGLSALDLGQPEVMLEAVRQHAALIRHFAENNGATVVVHRFALSGHQSVERLTEMASLVAECNGILDETLGDLGRLVWVDMAAEASHGDIVSDPRLWHLGRIPFSDSFSRRIVRRWTGLILSLLGKTSRLVILDLDNTLWGGVLGEDGPTGIAIGGDFPGNAFLRFQQTIKALSERGIALAVCSKNDEDLALDVLEKHDCIVIRPDDLVAHRINWQPKFQNIREIAAELDLGLGSVMFVDDNPVEREAVRRNLPMVKVLELPQDPASYSDALLASPFLETIRSGKEDLKRVASYKARKKINLERQSAASLEDFLRGLKMQLHLQPLADGNVARAAQLCQKTNQFNTTTRRYSARDLENLAAGGADVVVIGLQDKFTGQENIGLLILRADEAAACAGRVDLFLLSCRVLGRTVEQAVMGWTLNRARQRGWRMLHGEIVETPRNSPARQVFADNGFMAGAAHGSWQRETIPTEIPDWFELHDGFR